MCFLSGCGGPGREEKESDSEIKVTRGDLVLTVTSMAEVKPQNRLEIKPPVAGRMDEVLVREGDKVDKGAILAWMSSTERVVLLDAMALQKSEVDQNWQEIYKPTPLLAPISGTVIVRSVEPGQTVTTTDVVLVLADRLIVKAQVDETDVGLVKVGQRARMRLDAYPDESVGGAVDHVAYESELVNNVTIYEVDVVPDEVPPHFTSGMTADVEIETTKRANALLVPIEAVREAGTKKAVWVMEKGKRALAERTVEVGLNDGVNYESLSGLSDTDTGVVKGSPLKKKRDRPKGSFM
jgi:macrolide-specific efflux system membrane fusion protein